MLKSESGRAHGIWYLFLMTTQEKTNAIKSIVAYHQDNLVAKNNAQTDPGLDALVVQAMNNAFLKDLEPVFLLRPQPPGGRMALKKK
jgi:hypothetical protein